MLKLTFNTTDKTVLITEDGIILTQFTDIPTVKVREGYYEVMQKTSFHSETQIPVLRTPISNTLMFIEN